MVSISTFLSSPGTLAATYLVSTNSSDSSVIYTLSLLASLVIYSIVASRPGTLSAMAYNSTHVSERSVNY